jgi:dolichol-phosphate mannosyltransferase
MLKTVILIPTYNERENIRMIIPEIFAAHPEVHVLVIDDNSPDGTGAEVKALMEQYPNLELLARPGKQGLGAAYKHALEHTLALGDVERIVMMDADGSHPVEYLAAMFEASKTNDLVIGSRYTKGGGIENWEPWRYALSRYGNLYARTLTGLPVRDLTAGFLCFRGDLLLRMDVDRVGASGYAFLMDLKYHAIRDAGAQVKEVPIIFKSRREGESKISHHIIREGLKTPLRLFLRRIGFS